MSLFFAFLSGAILPLAFAPFNFWILSIVSLVILLYILKDASFASAFFKAWVYGLGVFGVGVSWVYVSIHDFGDTNSFLAILITILFISFISLFYGLLGLLLKLFYKKPTKAYSCIGFPIIWVFIEWFRSWFLTGFPWLLLGYSQTEGPLKSFAPIIGVYGISFLVALSSGIIFTILRIKKKNSYANVFTKKKSSKIFNIPVLLLVLIWLSSGFLGHINWTKTSKLKTKVAILQGNILPTDKFLLHNPITTTDNIYGKMTRNNLNAELIIWPENSLPLSLPYSQQYVDMMDKVAKNHNTTILLGLPIEVENDFDHHYNSIIAIGKSSGIYHKRQLVPFGDYLPLETKLRGLINFFNLPMSSFISGKDNQNLINTEKSKILPLICYEIAYPNLIRNSFKHDLADVIITVSEDGWFGKSIGPLQHFQIAKMRALETGRYVLRATTSGISAIINPHGNIEAKLPQFEKKALIGKYYNMEGKTPWLIFGTTPLLIILFILFLLTNDLFIRKISLNTRHPAA